MTIDESIEVLTSHKLHWERLLSEGICDAHEGKETISALTIALASLEAWEKVRQEVKQEIESNWGFERIGEENILAIIDKHLREIEE